MKTRWDMHLQIEDVFHNDGLTLPEKRAIILSRLRALPVHNDDDDEFEGILEELEHPVDPLDASEFNSVWDRLYAWADNGKRLWIQTF